MMLRTLVNDFCRGEPMCSPLAGNGLLLGVFVRVQRSCEFCFLSNQGQTHGSAPTTRTTHSMYRVFHVLGVLCAC